VVAPIVVIVPWSCRCDLAGWKKCFSRHRATCLPIFAPCSSEIRKWTPEYTRASTTSSVACEKREKLLVVIEFTPVALNRTLFVPKKSRDVSARRI
jgi:hypothetical protein